MYIYLLQILYIPMYPSFSSGTIGINNILLHVLLRQNVGSNVIKMHLAGHVTVLFTLVLFSPISVFGFPDGAPVDTCVKPRPNQPYHGEARSQSLNTSPYKILASSSQYEPGSQVTGEPNAHGVYIIKHHLGYSGLISYYGK